MVAAYGSGILSSMDYDTWCALYFNIPRVRLQKSWDTMQGLKMAQAKKLPRSVYEAQALTPELTKALEEKGNKSRFQQGFINQMKAALKW